MARKAKDVEIRGGCYFRMPDREENKDAPTYWERILPTLMTAEEYFATIEPKEEWYRRHEEQSLSRRYGAPVKVTLIKDEAG